jgi:hypothetical protein
MHRYSDEDKGTDELKEGEGRWMRVGMASIVSFPKLI